MITRAEYLADSAKLFHAYYLEFATALGIKFSPSDVARFAKALETDPHMNNIPLHWWDARGLALDTFRMQEVAKQKYDSGGISLSDRVCTLKAAARQAVLDAAKDKTDG